MLLQVLKPPSFQQISKNCKQLILGNVLWLRMKDLKLLEHLETSFGARNLQRRNPLGYTLCSEGTF